MALRTVVHGSLRLGVELTVGLAPSWIQWSVALAMRTSRHGKVESSSPAVLVVTTTVTMESKNLSSSCSWYKMDILTSSSEIVWIRRRQLPHPDGEVSGAMVTLYLNNVCAPAARL